MGFAASEIRERLAVSDFPDIALLILNFEGERFSIP